MTAQAPLTSRQRFRNACGCQSVDRPPIWMMRQAGRSLPEYRAVKEKHSFLEIVQTPELATEVTLQPIRRFGFDAAILFSDILVVTEAMGQPYWFREQGGIAMDFAVTSKEDIGRLDAEGVPDRLSYVAAALKMIRSELDEDRALLGFSGSPWTLANYMMEGGSTRELSAARELFYTEPRLFEELMEKLTLAITEYLQMQIDTGAVDAVQIFDSHGGVLAPDTFERASGQWIARIIAGLKGDTPVIVFSKGTHGCWDTLVNTGAQVLGVDWTVRLADVKALLPENVAVQGNLDPLVLSTTPKVAAAETTAILEQMRGSGRGHIFNLGHGVQPSSRIDAIEAVVSTVKNFR